MCAPYAAGRTPAAGPPSRSFGSVADQQAGIGWMPAAVQFLGQLREKFPAGRCGRFRRANPDDEPRRRTGQLMIPIGIVVKPEASAVCSDRKRQDNVTHLKSTGKIGRQRGYPDRPDGLEYAAGATPPDRRPRASVPPRIPNQGGDGIVISVIQNQQTLLNGFITRLRK